MLLGCARSSPPDPAAASEPTPARPSPVPEACGELRLEAEELRSGDRLIALARRQVVAVRVRACRGDGIEVLERCATPAQYAWKERAEGRAAGDFRGPGLALAAFSGSSCSRATHVVRRVEVGGDAPCRAHWTPLDACRKALSVTLEPLQPEASGPDQVEIEAGRAVLRGKAVRVPRFRIDRSEIDLDHWQRCVDAKACPPLPQRVPEARESARGCPEGSSPGEEPVRCVTYDEAAAYCSFAGGRLPTEAEWVRAARGASRQPYVWGDAWPPPEGAGNFADRNAARVSPHWRTFPHVDGFSGVHPVVGFGRDRARSGVLNLAGNVREWVGSVRRGFAAVRGASYGESDREALALGRTGRYRRSIRSAHVGFRCAHDPT